LVLLYKSIIRPLLFQLSAEKAHHFAFGSLKFLVQIPFFKTALKNFYQIDDKKQLLSQHLFGIDFPNPVGLAAGFDKNAVLLNEWEAFGFGFIEIGTVTPLPQEGNPKPRLFRLIQDKSIINRMGFNNEGMEKVLERLKKRKTKIIVGGNIGKNKITPNEKATDDYLKSFRALHKFVDYFVVNVSSPNTPNLRALQEKEPLLELLNALRKENNQFPKPKAILLKIAPDLSESQLDDVIDVVKEANIQGIVATNTTIQRENLSISQSKIEAIGQGGLSGQALTEHSTQIIRYLHQKSEGEIPIIAVGGIASPEQAIEKLEAGASLVQVYTGFIYEGPGLIKKINQKILEKNSVNSQEDIEKSITFS